MPDPTPQNPSVVHNPNQPNHSLDRRRDQRAAEQLAQDNAARITEMTNTALEAWQKHIEVSTQMAKFWVDALHANQQAFNQLINQTRRSA